MTAPQDTEQAHVRHGKEHHGAVLTSERTWFFNDTATTEIYTCSLRMRLTNDIQAAWATLLGVARSATGITVSIAMVPFSRNTSSKCALIACFHTLWRRVAQLVA